MRRALLWIPAVIAIAFLLVTGYMMVHLVGVTREAVLTNLRNTCYNSQAFRSVEEVERTCWSEYRRLGGR